jgi:hypothetical protein
MTPPNIRTVSICVATGSADKEGTLVLADGQLLAVLVHLADEIHGDDRGAWFLEAGFGNLAGLACLFPTLEEAVEWICQRLELDQGPVPGPNSPIAADFPPEEGGDEEDVREPADLLRLDADARLDAAYAKELDNPPATQASNSNA